MPPPRPDAGGPPPSEEKSLRSTLLERLRSREDDAWRRLDHLYGPVVFGWCRGAGLRADDAADVRQEVFRAVAGAIAGFRRDQPGDSFRGWLWHITQNKLRDFFRRQRQQPVAAGGTTFQQQLQEVPFPEGGETAAPGASAEEQGEVYRRALDLVRGEFEERTWQAFWRTAVEGRSAAEAAAGLGMSAGAVYVAKSRVLRRLREEFGELLE